MNRIKDLREDKDMTQKELAKIIGITQATLSDYEVEKTEPKKDIWVKLASFFDVSIDYLMGQTNNPSNEEFTKGLTEEEIKDLTHYRDLLKIKRAVENNKKISTYENTK